MVDQNTVEIENLRNREARATEDYFRAIRAGAREGELRRLITILDDIHRSRRRREGIGVDW